MLNKALVAGALVAGLALFLLGRDWDSPELGRTLLQKVSEATGVEIEAEGFRLNLLRGLVLETVAGASETKGRELTFSLDRLVFEHRIAPLFSGVVAIDRVVFESPHIQIVELGKRDPTEKAVKEETADKLEETNVARDRGAGGSGLSLEVQEVSIRNGVVVIKNADEAGVMRVEGLDFQMDRMTIDPGGQTLAAISAEGSLAIERILFDSLELVQTKGRFELAEACFDLSELSFSSRHGVFVAEMSVDFNPLPFTYSLAAAGDPLDLNGIVGADEGFGASTVRLDAKGAGSASKDVRADGSAHLDEGSFPAISVFTGIDEALGKSVLAGASYQATEMRFHLENEILRLSPFRFEADNARLDLSGWVDLAGRVAFDLSVATPREGIEVEGVGADVLDVLADDAGWVPVPFRISGTIEDPRIRPDTKALLAQTGSGVKRAVTDRATDALRGLIKKKQN